MHASQVRAHARAARATLSTQCISMLSRKLLSRVHDSGRGERLGHRRLPPPSLAAHTRSRHRNFSHTGNSATFVSLIS